METYFLRHLVQRDAKGCEFKVISQDGTTEAIEGSQPCSRLFELIKPQDPPTSQNSNFELLKGVDDVW